MRKIPVSVFIITQDEEKNIERVLDSVKNFDEIVVVDSGSQDRTVEIAKQKNAKVVFNAWEGFARQKQFAMELCKNEWVFNLDADEEMTDSVFNEIKKIIQQDEFSSARFFRNDILIGKKMPVFMRLPNHVRLYKKSMAAFEPEDLVHETAKVSGKEKQVKTDFMHYGYDAIDVLIDKNNSYSSLKAQEKFKKNKSPSLLKLVTIVPLEFIRKFFFQRYFLYGLRGVILAMVNANYAFLKEAKLFELHMRSKNNKK